MDTDQSGMTIIGCTFFENTASEGAGTKNSYTRSHNTKKSYKLGPSVMFGFFRQSEKYGGRKEIFPKGFGLFFAIEVEFQLTARKYSTSRFI